MLSDNGQLQNYLQKGVTAQRLNLTLYTTHLVIKDIKSNQIIEDVPIEQIKKTTKYFSSRLSYTLSSLVKTPTFFIETNNKKYKLSWVNRDKEAVILGGIDATLLSTQQNFKKNNQWSKTISDLKSKQ